MAAILKQIFKGKLKVNPVLVFSDQPAAKGLELAKSYGLETHSFSPKDFSNRNDYEAALAELLKEKSIDWVIAAGYMRILKAPILNTFPDRVLNIHPSLLPAFTGLKAQKQALDYGVRYTGCTVHLVDAGMDTGPIITQTIVSINPDDTEQTLSRRILKAEHDTYWRAIKSVIAGFRRDGRQIILSKN